MVHFLFQSIFYLSVIFKILCQFSYNFYNVVTNDQRGVIGETVAAHIWPT